MLLEFTLQKARSEADLQGGAAAASKSSKAKKVRGIGLYYRWMKEFDEDLPV